MKLFLDKFKNAFRGLFLGIRNTSIKIQITLMVLAILFGMFMNFNLLEWCILLLCCLIVVSLEFINTVFEKIMDFIQPEYHETVRDIKDLGAGFVLFASIVVLIIGCLLIGGKLL